MAARNKIPTNGASLFQVQESESDRRLRRQRALFIPRIVRETAVNEQLHDEAQDRAHAIAIRWADLETAGHLPLYKETSIDTQFLDQLFGDGLGYRVKTSSPMSWELEHKITVAGIGIADGALGLFPDQKQPTVVIELKGARTDLDRDRSNGRTAVQQCWDYLNALPECSWGIVSNFRTIRLYHKTRGNQNYEEYALQELRNRDTFIDFYCLFQRDGLLTSRTGQQSRALTLLTKTIERQKIVGDELYKFYQGQRIALIEHLHLEIKKDLNESIRIAQKLLDRIIFIAFCEDRGLLPEKTLRNIPERIRTYSHAKNPEWEAFCDLFKAINIGSKGRDEISKYNGGLFKDDPAIDALELESERWTDAFVNFGKYDFSEEVNVEVLGHLFERSITELEKLRIGGLFALAGSVEKPSSGAMPTALGGHVNPGKSNMPTQSRGHGIRKTATAKMAKSAQRKRFGIYYTPPAFTGLIVERTVDALVKERFAAIAQKLGVDPEARENGNAAKLLTYWTDCLEELKAVTVCDPACGSGAFLIRAYDALEAHYNIVVHGLAGAGLSPKEVAANGDSIPDLILSKNLYGVDLSREAVEISQLALWIRSARRGKTLADLSHNIVHGNSLVSDAAVDPHALDWPKAFPEVFAKGGFACVIGNPPWERVKLQEREFFSLTDPETASAVSAADRRKRIAAMPKDNAELFTAYKSALGNAQKILDYARNSEQYPLTGKGDINLYMLFAERAGNIVAPNGMAGLLVPSGIATDDTTKEFFASLMDAKRLAVLYDFENRDKVFEDVDGRFKFSSIIFGGKNKDFEECDFVFFAHSVEETAESNKQRHIPLTAKDMALLNPNTKTCPIFRTRRDADLTKRIYKRVPILIDENRKKGGNPWSIKFFTMFHQTNDAEHFQPATVWTKKGYKLDGNVYIKGKKRALPLYEAKMVQAFDHRAASVMIEEENWVRQGQKNGTSLVEHQNPEYGVTPRWWVDEAAVNKVTESIKRDWMLGYKDITSATNERTMIASFMPWTAVVNSAPLIFPGSAIAPRLESCLLANLNTTILDFIARQKVGSVHLNFFIVEQLPTLPPDTYAEKCRWSKRETLEHWISERVLKLSCTAEDMIPLAKACGFAGSRGDGVHIWKEDERATLRAELDAAYFHLYGIGRDDAAYILSTFTNTGLAAESDRDRQQYLWSPGSTGEIILQLYDEYAKAF